MKRIVSCTALAIFLMLVTAHADTIILNTGRSIEGEIVQETLDEVVVRQASGVVTRISRDDIEDIVRTKDLEKEYKAKLAEISDADTISLMQLAEWCRERGLKEQYRSLLERIIKAEPENADAKKQLDILNGKLPDNAETGNKEDTGITFAPGSGESGTDKQAGERRKIWKDDKKKNTEEKIQKIKVVPPFGGSSKGTGGTCPVNGSTMTVEGASYNLIVPGSYAPSKPNPLMIVYSGVEGRSQMTQNLLQLRGRTGTGTFIFAVLDGRHASASHGAAVIDELRKKYNIDNDRTYLLSESAGTRAGLQLGFNLRQSYFAAFWANDVTCSGKPGKNFKELGFKPHGNSGPGGNFPAAKAIVAGMRDAGYRLPPDAPYSGPGCGIHGDPRQFTATLKFFLGKSRQ
jgi:hypothetical protein